MRSLIEAAENALSHIREMRVAWERGAIHCTDGEDQDAIRSNRNIECEAELSAAIAAASPEKR